LLRQNGSALIFFFSPPSAFRKLGGNSLTHANRAQDQALLFHVPPVLHLGFLVREHGDVLASVLKFADAEIGAAYGAFAIGSMISPFFVGLIADRCFASEKMLAVLGIVGGGVLCALPHVAVFKTFYPTLILYCALYAPTLALGNSLSLHHLHDSKNDFPRVKIFSAVGWIAGGVTLSFLNGEQSSIQFYLAGAASILLGAF
jgi:MFS family permease